MLHFFSQGGLTEVAERITLSQLDTNHSIPDVQCSLVILADFLWCAHLYGKMVSPVLCQLLNSTPGLLRSVNAVVVLVMCLHKSHVGNGNGDENFQELWQTRKVYSSTNFCSILFICMFAYMNRNGNNGLCRITTTWYLDNSSQSV